MPHRDQRQRHEGDAEDEYEPLALGRATQTRAVQWREDDPVHGVDRIDVPPIRATCRNPMAGLPIEPDHRALHRPGHHEDFEEAPRRGGGRLLPRSAAGHVEAGRAVDRRVTFVPVLGEAR